MTQDLPAPSQHNMPQSMRGRAALLVLSVGMLALGIVALALMLRANGLTWGEWYYRLAMAEAFTVLVAAGVLSLLWAIATPSWLPALARKAGRFLAVCFLIPWVLLLGIMMWA